MKKWRTKIKYTAKGKQMLNDPQAFVESFFHATDNCTGKLLTKGDGIATCNICSKQTTFNK